MSLRRHWKVLLAVGVVLLAAVAYVGQDQWRDRCGAFAEQLSADDLGSVLLPREQLAEKEATLVDRLDDLPEPFGPVVAGRVFNGVMERPSVGAVDDDSFFLAGRGSWATGENDGQVAIVDADSGEATWGIGSKRATGDGGPVGDAFVTLMLPEDKAPVVQAYDLESGDRTACTTLDEDQERGFDPTLDSVALGDGDVVTAHDRGGKQVLTRLEPGSGERRWTRILEQRGGDVHLDDAGGVVVAGALGASDQLGGVPWSPGMVIGFTALDAGTGEVAWTWPDAPPAQGAVVAKVVGADPERGRLHVLESSRAAGADESTMRLVTLDDEGTELWSRRVPDRCDAARWDDLVVTACGQPTLTAYDAASGDERWSTRDVLENPHMLAVGRHPSVDLGDGSRLQLGGDEVVRIDTETGKSALAVAKKDLRTYVSGMEAVGDHLVLSTRDGIFVLERED